MTQRSGWIAGRSCLQGPGSRHLQPIAPCCPQETEQRFNAWTDNLRYIEEYNAKHSSHWVRHQ